MGTFAHYEGNMNIAEDKKQDFSEKMLKVLNYGGMMQFEKVNIYGKSIALLKSPEANEDGRVSFHYNYFEDDGWETADYDVNNMDLYSQKIGTGEFNAVITAAYSLYEVCNEGESKVYINRWPIDIEEYVGWLNHVLGTDFSAKNRFLLWEYFEREKTENPKEHISIKDIIELVPAKAYKGIGGIDFADICYIIEGTKDLEEDKVISGSYSEAVLECRKLLETYYLDAEDSKEVMEILWKMLKRSYDERKDADDTLKVLAELSLRLPARVFVYLTAELLEMDFWKLWLELKDEVYHDECLDKYISEELQKQREEIRKRPIAPVDTKTFLCYDGYFAYHNTPEELKGKPNYVLTDDERAYWWDGEEDFFSEDMDAWLKELAERHKYIMEVSHDISKIEFLKAMVDVLKEVEETYKRVYAFQDMFYDFACNGLDKRYYAAVLLLKELCDENKEDGKIIEKVGWSWDLTSRNVTFNIGRRKMKRYLSVMANRKLRMKYFEF